MNFKLFSFYRLLFTVPLLLLFGCRTISSQVILSSNQPVIVHEPLLIPQDSSNAVFIGLDRKKSVVKYYQELSGNPIWIANGKHTASADSLIYVLRHIQYYGFRKSSFHLTELENLNSNVTELGLIRKEVLLTDAFFSLAFKLKHGFQKVPSDTDSIAAVMLNKSVLGENIKNILESQEPASIGYASLKKGLRLMFDSAEEHNIDSVTLQEKIRLISINLERWRADPAEINGRYIFINIPSYMLDVVEKDSVALTSKVIVGTPEKETPMLSSLVECLSIYPYWHVPRKIAVEEFLPVIKTNLTFISRNNFDVLDKKGNLLNPDSVPWNKFDENYFPVVLRQREGPENSLGIIKFIFDNPHAVFLHDTNAKRLFNNKVRAFSHGCIRMEKAAELAHYLVTGVVGRESKYINKFLKEKQQHWVDLKNPIPIHIRYFTCEFKNNRFFRYDDIYHKDRFLYELIYQETVKIDL
jgi:murein L,D-transpeptidase YcbB/YkuD